MEYQEARNKIKSGDLIAFSRGSWKTISGAFSNIIRIFTTSEYSHVGMAWVVSNRVFLLEATMPKLRIYPLSHAGDFYHISLNSPWKPETEEYALSKIGVKYSVVSAIKAYFAPLENGNVEQCAAYVREVLEMDGVDLGEYSRPDSLVQTALELGNSLNFVRNKK